MVIVCPWNAARLRVITEPERPGLGLRWFGFNAESGLSQKSVDEGGPVLDALEPVLHDVTAASWLGELQEPRLPRLFFMFAQAGVHAAAHALGRGPVPEGAAPRASCVYSLRGKAPSTSGPITCSL